MTSKTPKEDFSQSVEKRLTEEEKRIYERVFQQAFFEQGLQTPDQDVYNDYALLYGELKTSLLDTRILPIEISVTGEEHEPNCAQGTRKGYVKWTPEENRQLIKLKADDPGSTWEQISNQMDKTPRQCCQQWHRVCQAIKKGRWSAQEDSKLREQWGHCEVYIDGRSLAQIKMRAQRLGLK